MIHVIQNEAVSLPAILSRLLQIRVVAVSFLAFCVNSRVLVPTDQQKREVYRISIQSIETAFTISPGK